MHCGGTKWFWHGCNKFFKDILHKSKYPTSMCMYTHICGHLIKKDTQNLFWHYAFQQGLGDFSTYLFHLHSLLFHNFIDSLHWSFTKVVFHPINSCPCWAMHPLLQKLRTTLYQVPVTWNTLIIIGFLKHCYKLLCLIFLEKKNLNQRKFLWTCFARPNKKKH